MHGQGLPREGLPMSPNAGTFVVILAALETCDAPVVNANVAQLCADTATELE